MKHPAKSSVTIYDVAHHASVAISTVSRVLNGSPDVSEVTRSKVEQAISDLRYHPNRTARSLAQQEIRSLAVAIPSFTAPFQNELLKGIRSYLREIDHDLLICDLGSSNQAAALKTFLSRGAVSGLLLCGLPLTESLARELNSGRSPCVLVGHRNERFDSWSWDDHGGAKAAVNHLIKQGHRRIAMIRSGIESESQVDRIRGYKDALKEAGLEADPSWIVAGAPQYHGGFSEEDGQEAMQRILETHPECTAVFCSSDVQAIGALAALHDAGRSVPEDMALIGYDDIKTSRFIGLSSVDQRMQDIGRAAAERLYERVSNPTLTTDNVDHVVQPRLAVRRSSMTFRNS